MSKYFHCSVIYEQKLKKDTKTLLEFSRTRKRKIKENGSKKMRDSHTREENLMNEFLIAPQGVASDNPSWASLFWNRGGWGNVKREFYQSITTHNLHVIQNTSSTMPFNLLEHPQHTREVSNIFEDFFLTTLMKSLEKHSRSGSFNKNFFCILLSLSINYKTLLM